MPRISVVFTSYNHKEFLAEAIDSLLGQTFSDFELIIVDDCSTDGSQVMLTDYAKKDSRIRLYLNKKNSGSYVHSTNLGASKATAPYVVFAQCDDYAEPTQFEKLYSAMVENPSVGVVFSASKMVDKFGCNLGQDFDVREKMFKKQCRTNTLLTKRKIERYFLCSCVIPNLSAALVKRDLFEKQGGLSSDYFVLADWDFWLKTSQESDFYYLRESLNNFRQHDTTIRVSIKLQRQVEEVFRMYYDFFRCSNMSFFRSLRWRYHVATVWAHYFWSSKRVWLKSLFPLMGRGMRYDPLLPAIALVSFVGYVFTSTFYKIQKSFINK